ncbi:MAG TPA: DNA replication and repair protein RecF [Flavitalea sp.]|nr:DNA replication and repair protein RecF [Flavitalea sp.]
MLQLQTLSLIQFKNYQEAYFSFPARVTGICGPNGKGKTNLLDAIHYLCFTKSYFTKTDSQNVFHGTQGFRIEGHFIKDEIDLKTVCILRETGKKEFSVDESAYEKFAEHIGRFPCVVIAPDDVEIITGGSEERRRFLDILLSQLDAGYLRNLIDYMRVLHQRNSYLKLLAADRMHDPELLEVYDRQLVSHGTEIFHKRFGFLSAFIQEVIAFYGRIAGTEEPVSIDYESSLLSLSFDDLLLRNRDRDLFLQRTTGGIHRDDLLIRLRGEPFKQIASQGQRKSLLFALKLAEFEVLKQAKGFSPLLLLDDVFEKLDEKRMHHLLSWVCKENAGQIFLTDTHPGRIAEHLNAIGVPFGMIGL